MHPLNDPSLRDFFSFPNIFGPIFQTRRRGIHPTSPTSLNTPTPPPLAYAPNCQYNERDSHWECTLAVGSSRVERGGRTPLGPACRTPWRVSGTLPSCSPGARGRGPVHSWWPGCQDVCQGLAQHHLGHLCLPPQENLRLNI